MAGAGEWPVSPRGLAAAPRLSDSPRCGQLLMEPPPGPPSQGKQPQEGGSSPDLGCSSHPTALEGLCAVGAGGQSSRSALHRPHSACRGCHRLPQGKGQAGWRQGQVPVGSRLHPMGFGPGCSSRSLPGSVIHPAWIWITMDHPVCPRATTKASSKAHGPHHCPWGCSGAPGAGAAAHSQHMDPAPEMGLGLWGHPGVFHPGTASTDPHSGASCGVPGSESAQ